MDIDYPFHFGNDGRTASAGLDDHVRDMVEQLLFTSPGERVNRPDFGSGLMQLVFAPNSPELAATLKFGLQASLTQWLGDVIEIVAIDVAAEDAALCVELAYRVRATGELRNDSFVRSVP